jgi:hypothetical protein
MKTCVRVKVIILGNQVMPGSAGQPQDSFGRVDPTHLVASGGLAGIGCRDQSGINRVDQLPL